MEEADALSDRIGSFINVEYFFDYLNKLSFLAIMNHGEVKCCGSPMFLKNLYGSGYRLTASKSDKFNQMAYLNLIQQNAEKYKIETNIAGEITVSLPYDAVEKLPLLLRQIEDQKVSLGVTSYGISSPTIEEVFLK